MAVHSALQVNIRRAARVPAAVRDYTRRQVRLAVPSATLVSTRQRTLVHVPPVLQDSLAALVRRVVQTASPDSTVSMVGAYLAALDSTAAVLVLQRALRVLLDSTAIAWAV